MTKKNSKKKLSESTRSYVKYSSMGVQMLVTILIGVLIGYFLDEKFETNNLFTAFFSLLFVVIALYSVLKGLIEK